MSVINDAQTNRVCALSITITSYCFITDARVLEKFVKISGVHTGIRLQTTCSYRGTADSVVNSE